MTFDEWFASTNNQVEWLRFADASIASGTISLPASVAPAPGTLEALLSVPAALARTLADRSGTGGQDVPRSPSGQQFNMSWSIDQLLQSMVTFDAQVESSAVDFTSWAYREDHPQHAQRMVSPSMA